ncbi:Phosphatidylglycerol/phosphatidylinositol transfer protein [Coemansia erecta]|nr:Phosphatidylglycerol/phosphatidylinositol transfer protein [Coemansia sp. RSA 2618]KAJ2822799.1 Phosphatidylglycerol/phosphatidylinositol transfer protein [Coemansia erecta]
MKLIAPLAFALGAAHTCASLAIGEHLQLAVQEASGMFIDMLDARTNDDMGKNRTLNDLIRDVSHDDDLIDIDYVDVDPEKPRRSTPVHLTALAHVKERIDAATANVKVKYGFLTLLNRNYDLCEELKNNLNKSCPVDEGPIEFSVDVDVPGFIPPGWFHLEATAWRDSDEKQLGRILADVKF